MKINGANSSLFTDAFERKPFPDKTYEEASTEQNKNPVRVTISEKGKEYYRKSTQELVGDTESYDAMIERKNQLLEANLSTDLDYDFQLGGEVGKYKQAGVYLSTEEKADNLLKAYANLYDEMMQGYESGTREIHVEDKNSEKGYRILTKEEESIALDNSYKKYADSLEEGEKQELDTQKVFEKYMKKLSEIGVKKPSLAQSYYDSIYLKKKDEILPENISKKTVDAVSIFKRKYMMIEHNKINLSDLLATIKIF